jgi:hypothetical protein
MSNSNRAEMRTSLGLSEATFRRIIDTYNAGAVFVGDDFANVVPDTLNAYEEEILRLREVNARLRNKNRNYRTGIKHLQRAHEATLHRLAAVQDTSEQYRQLLVMHVGGVDSGVTIVHDGPYSPVHFDDDILELPVERQAELAKSI